MTRFERSLLILLAACFAGLWIYDCQVLHPWFSYFDEGNGSVAPLQIWREGGVGLPFELARGCLHRDLAALNVLLLGPSPWAWRLLDGAAIALECVLLARLAAQWGGRPAALGALLFNLVSALTFVRARSLNCYALLPLELLAMLAWMPACRGRWSSALFGLAAAALALDYEGWILALGVLLLMRWRLKRGPQWASALGAFAIGIALLAWMSWEGLSQQLALRGRVLGQAGQGHLAVLLENARALVMGSWSYGYMAVSHHPVLPPWSWPLLALGLYGVLRVPGRRWILGWLGIGMLPLVAVGTAGGSNRLIAAWPALALLAGVGWAEVDARVKSVRAKMACLVLACVFGGIWEARAYAASMEEQYPAYYAEAAGLARAARAEKAKGPARFISELDNESSAMWRFIWEAEGPPQGGDRAVLLEPRQYLDGSGPGAPYVLAEAGPAEAARMQAIQDVLLPLRAQVPLHHHARRLALIMGYFAGHPQMDPWLRSALLENALSLGSRLGLLPPPLLAMALNEKLASASAPLWLAGQASQSGDQALARRLCARAMQIDPGRECSY